MSPSPETYFITPEHPISLSTFELPDELAWLRDAFYSRSGHVPSFAVGLTSPELKRAPGKARYDEADYLTGIWTPNADCIGVGSIIFPIDQGSSMIVDTSMSGLEKALDRNRRLFAGRSFSDGPSWTGLSRGMFGNFRDVQVSYNEPSWQSQTTAWSILINRQMRRPDAWRTIEHPPLEKIPFTPDVWDQWKGIFVLSFHGFLQYLKDAGSSVELFPLRGNILRRLADYTLFWNPENKGTFNSDLFEETFGTDVTAAFNTWMSFGGTPPPVATRDFVTYSDAVNELRYTGINPTDLLAAKDKANVR